MTVIAPTDPGLPKRSRWKSIWLSITGTANEIIGICVGSLALGGAMIAAEKARRKRKQEQKKQDEENRALLLSLPKVITELGSTLTGLSERIDAVDKQTRSTEAGVQGLGGAMQLQTMNMNTLADKMDYITQCRIMELEEDGVCWWECDPDGFTTDVSQPLCELFGMSREKMLEGGNGWLNAIEGQNATAWENWYTSVKDRRPYKDRYTIVNQKTGKRYKVESTAKRFETAKRQTLCFRGRVNVVEEG